MNRLTIFLSFLCFYFVQVSFGQPPMTDEQLRNWRNARMVSQFASPDWSGQLIKTSRTERIDNVLPVRGLAIAAPSVRAVDQFVRFIEEELAPAHFNMLILRVDWNYAYESHPELRDSDPLTRADVKKIVEACKRHNIQVAPQINLLGHQSWSSTTHNLLRVYPQFDEAPHIRTQDYADLPNPRTASNSLYCKSYCPLHPDVHRVVFALVDELMDVFEAHWFHAGMDEVFHLADERCPRCRGKCKAELFAGEVNKIQDHLAKRNRRLMIWADRLIDGQLTGLGAWEASMNNTAPAIDMINKDVYMCDWHYERADLTAVWFAMKGFDVATCPWRNPELAAIQLQNMLDFRRQTLRIAMGPRFQGIIQTVWSGADQFLRAYYDPASYTVAGSPADNTNAFVAQTVKRMMDEFKKLNE